jgi:membrane dipeptidase
MNVTAEMVKRGYTEEEIAKIWSGNTLALWRRVDEAAKALQ